MDLREKNKLLHTRAGFGISLEDYQHPLPIPDAVARLFPKSPPAVLEVISKEEWSRYGPGAMMMLGEMQRKEQQQVFMGRMKDVNQIWLSEMISTPYPLLEKMTLFWHGHFATKLDNPYYDQTLLNIFRKHALGNFGDLLRAVSKNEVMVLFLNNKQNVKDHPNENFAREVMELFTLGRDNDYTEHDVVEAARAFTGWTLDNDGGFLIRDDLHDDGEKQFLGKRGKFNGDDILNMLLEHKQTARYVTQKLYRFLVNDEHIDEQRVESLAAKFYSNKYDITALLKDIFMADWFYSADVPGAKIKSPIELLVGFQRMLPIVFNSDRTNIQLQRILGQHLFNPPNVAGWPGGKFWIDSTSLVIRMKLPEAMFMAKDEEAQTQKPVAQESPGAMMPNTGMNVVQNIDFPLDERLNLGGVKVDWTNYLAYWKKQQKEKLPVTLANFLLQIPVPDELLKEVAATADKGSDDNYIKSLTVLLMKLPEYQLA